MREAEGVNAMSYAYNGKRELSGWYMKDILRCVRACRQHGQWNKTSSAGGLFLYFCFYGRQEPAFDNSTKPEDYEEVTYKADGSIDFVFVMRRLSLGRQELAAGRDRSG
ncbi:hypothetical protein [Nitrospira sp. Nam74]